MAWNKLLMLAWHRPRSLLGRIGASRVDSFRGVAKEHQASMPQHASAGSEAFEIPPPRFPQGVGNSSRLEVGHYGITAAVPGRPAWVIILPGCTRAGRGITLSANPKTSGPDEQYCGREEEAAGRKVGDGHEQVPILSIMSWRFCTGARKSAGTGGRSGCLHGVAMVRLVSVNVVLRSYSNGILTQFVTFALPSVGTKPANQLAGQRSPRPRVAGASRAMAP